jgi:alpha-tubulin suppressor-like RCC1 family protein
MKKQLTLKAQILSTLAIIAALALTVTAFISTSTSSREAQALSQTTLIAAGSNTSQVITKDGTRLGRGENNVGQLGLGNYNNQRKWLKTNDETTFTQLAAPYKSSVALSTDGKVFTWGDNQYQQLGVNSISSRSTPSEVIIAYQFDKIASGENFSIALGRDKHIYVWGDNSSGQLGTGNTTNVENPTVIIPNIKFSSIAAGKNYTLALDETGRLWSWGNNTHGQLGTGNTENAVTPTQISDQPWNFINTNSTSETSVAINTDGKLFTWGSNTVGQLANGSNWRQEQADENARVEAEIKAIQAADAKLRADLITKCETDRAAAAPKPQPEPVPTIPPTPGPTPVPTPTATPVPTPTPTPTYTQTCEQEVDAIFKPTDTSNIKPRIIPEPALTPDGLTPQPATSNETFVYAAIGSQNGFAINENETLYGWGSDKNGQTGVGVTDEKTHTQTPVQVTSDNDYITVDVGDGFAAAVSDDNELYTWGSNDNGSLAAADANRNTPGLVAPNIVSVKLAAKTGYATDTNNVLSTWGKGANNMLGDGSDADRGSLGATTQTVTSVSPGGSSVLALNQLGQLVSWGNNGNKTFGNPDIADSKTPIIIGANSFQKVAAGNATSYALDNRGTVWGWGLNTTGQIGENGANGTTANAIFIPIPGETKLIASTNDTGVAVTEDNKVYIWGHGNPAVREIINTANITQIAAGANHIVLLDDAGNVWEWSTEQNGLTTPLNETNFTKVENTGVIKTISAGANVTIGVNDKGELVGWGDNINQQLLNNQTDFSTPQIIDNTRTYKTVSVGQTHVLATDNNDVVYGWGNEPYGTFGSIATTQKTPFVLPITEKITSGDNE